MGDLYLLVLSGKAYLVTWMPKAGTTMVCVKGWRVYSTEQVIARIPALGALVTMRPPDGTGLSTLSWRYDAGVECRVRTPWPREPDFTQYLSVPTPTRPNASLVYRFIRRITPKLGKLRAVPFDTGTDGWEYVRNVLLAANTVPPRGELPRGP